MEKNEVRQRSLDRLKNMVLSGKQRGAAGSIQDANNSPKSGGTQFLDELSRWVENLDESNQFILGRDFVRNFDVRIDLNNAMFRIRNPENEVRN